MDQYTQLLIYLAGPAIGGVIGAVIKLWIDFHAHKVEIEKYKTHIAENYLKKIDIEELRSDVKQTRDIAHQIAGKLGVPTGPF